MARRTDVRQSDRVQTGEDLDRLVRDKRETKRANKRKATRRNRHYVRTLLRHMQPEPDDSLDG